MVACCWLELEQRLELEGRQRSPTSAGLASFGTAPGSGSGSFYSKHMHKQQHLGESASQFPHPSCRREELHAVADSLGTRDRFLTCRQETQMSNMLSYVSKTVKNRIWGAAGHNHRKTLRLALWPTKKCKLHDSLPSKHKLDSKHIRWPHATKAQRLLCLPRWAWICRYSELGQSNAHVYK